MLGRNLHLSILIMSLVIASADIDMTGAVPMSSACQIDNNTEPNNHQNNEEMSKAGYNFMKDLFPVGRPFDVNTLRDYNFNILQINQIKSLEVSQKMYCLYCILSAFDIPMSIQTKLLNFKWGSPPQHFSINKCFN